MTGFSPLLNYVACVGSTSPVSYSVAPLPTSTAKSRACVHAELLQSCPILFDPMDSTCSSVHGILWARILEWVAIPSSRGSFRLRDQTHTSCSSWLAGGFFKAKPLGRPQSPETYLSLCAMNHTFICWPWALQSGSLLPSNVLDQLLMQPIETTPCSLQYGFNSAGTSLFLDSVCLPWQEGWPCRMEERMGSLCVCFYTLISYSFSIITAKSTKSFHCLFFLWSPSLSFLKPSSKYFSLWVFLHL